jgi:hypothetical protein
MGDALGPIGAVITLGLDIFGGPSSSEITDQLIE